jgi:Ino eighty subunit 2
MSRRTTRASVLLNASSSTNAPSITNTGRPRRAAAMASSHAIVERSDPEDRASLKLTVKSQPSKLRQVTTGRATRAAGTRAAARRRPIVEVTSSEEEDEEVEEEEEEEEEEDDEEGDAEGEEDEEMVDAEEEEEDEDAEGEEDEEIDEDEPMDEPPPPPPAPKSRVPGRAAPVAAPRPSKAAPVAPAKSKVPPLPDSDEELSSLDSLEDEDQAMGDEDDEGGEEDAEGEDELGEEDEELDEEDAEGESDLGDSDELGSREGTPDLSKLTRRQRADYDPTELMALSNEAQKKKHLSAEEYAMRRAEMARRRKNLSEKRNEEEKVNFILQTANFKMTNPFRWIQSIDCLTSKSPNADVKATLPMEVRHWTMRMLDHELQQLLSTTSRLLRAADSQSLMSGLKHLLERYSITLSGPLNQGFRLLVVLLRRSARLYIAVIFYKISQ